MEQAETVFSDPRVIPAEVWRRIQEYRQTPSASEDSSSSPSAAETAPPRCPVCLDTGYVRKAVPVTDPDFGKAHECTQCSLIAERRAFRLFQQAQVPPHFAGLSFETFPFDPDNHAAVEIVGDWAMGGEYFSREHQGSLLIWGDFGRGKTGLAIAAMRARMECRGERGLFITTPALLDRIRATYGPGERQGTEAEVIDAVKSVPLLVLDDLGAERVTDWVAEKLFTVINHRHDYRLSTIFTSNLSPTQLALHLGERTAWRIVEMSYALELSGPNLRERGEA